MTARTSRALRQHLPHVGAAGRRVLEHLLDHPGAAMSSNDMQAVGHAGAHHVREQLKHAGVNLHRHGTKPYRWTLAPDGHDTRRALRRRNSARAAAALIKLHGPSCELCQQPAAPGDLQGDHRVPFELLRRARRPEPAATDLHAWQLACGPCNTRKAQACKACPLMSQGPSACEGCFWQRPATHTHTAGTPGRTTVVAHSNAEQADAALSTARIAHAAGDSEGDLAAALLLGVHRQAREAGARAAADRRQHLAHLDVYSLRLHGRMPDAMDPTAENVAYLQALAAVHGGPAPSLQLDLAVQFKRPTRVHDPVMQLRHYAQAR